MHIMKLLIASALISFSTSAHAQVSADSMATLKQQKQAIELSGKINERKMQLAKLENSVDKKTKDAEQAAEDARQAANDNTEAAAKLSNDPQDKSLAKKARKAASNAERQAKRARNAADDLTELKKDIETLRSKISDDEAKLASNPVGGSVKQ